MTRLIGSFAGLAVLLTAMSANAQISNELLVSVPFSFTVAGKSSPPGEYRVSINRETNIATLRTGGSSSAMFLTYGTSQAQNTRSYLRFHRYGERWFLEQVTIGGLAQDVLIAKRSKEVFTASATRPGGPLSADIAIH